MFGRGISPYGTYGLSAATKTGINWSNLLSNTQKTLGIINQAIPAFYQVKPIFNNMKTMFRVVNELNKEDITNKKRNKIPDNVSKTKYSTSNYQSVNQEIYNSGDEGPNFFV